MLIPLLINQIKKNNMDRVVKCKNSQCEQHFMHTKEATACPFCHTKYGEVEEKTTEKATVNVEEKPKKEEKIKDKEDTATTQKGAFKIKIVKNKDR